MTEKLNSNEEKKSILRKSKAENRTPEHNQPQGGGKGPLTALHQKVGNRAVQRLLAQRSGNGPFELDDETAGRINSQRSGGQSLDSTVQTQMGAATGYDFSSVKVHTDSESHTLNEQLSSKAFTTGQDIFFRSGAYDPGSSGGQELLAHELTHVVQQGTGRVNSGGRMTVNAPGDAFEQEADSVAQGMSSIQPQANLQRQEEDEEIQMQEEDEEIQMQELEDEQEELGVS
jgi:hypothetical protein